MHHIKKSFISAKHDAVVRYAKEHPVQTTIAAIAVSAAAVLAAPIGFLIPAAAFGYTARRLHLQARDQADSPYASHLNASPGFKAAASYVAGAMSFAMGLLFPLHVATQPHNNAEMDAAAELFISNRPQVVLRYNTMPLSSWKVQKNAGVMEASAVSRTPDSITVRFKGEGENIVFYTGANRPDGTAPSKRLNFDSLSKR